MSFKKSIQRVAVYLTWGVSGSLLLACLAYFTSPFPLLDALSILVPWLVIGNLILTGLLIFRKNRIVFLPILTLLIAFVSFGSIYKWGSKPDMKTEEGIRIMTYNTRSFGDGRYVSRYDIENKISSFVLSEDPGIISFQEFNNRKRREFEHYPYRFITPASMGKSTQAIYSKYPIVNTGFIEFPDTGNNCIYADVLYKEDTLRIYNVHLQSYNIGSRRFLWRNYGIDFLRRLNSVAKKHREQAQLVREHREASPYPSVICGDFNATPFSHTYRILKGNMQDSFREQGSGWGTTFYLSSRFPFRIDYILSDDRFEILSHQNFQVRLSDHLPVMAILKPKGEEPAVR